MNYCESFCRTIQRLCNTGGLLPSAYQQVEYLQSTGTQYITTGVITNTCAGISVKTKTGYSGSNHAVFGAQGGSAGNYRNYYAGRGASNITFNIGSYNTFSINATDTDIFDFDLTTINGSYTAKNNDIIISSGSYNQSYVNQINTELFLFAEGYQGTAYGLGNKNIYHCKLYVADNGERALVRDFIPCYRKSDNKPGMYDLVTNTFFTNAGSGEFIVGANV